MHNMLHGRRYIDKQPSTLSREVTFTRQQVHSVQEAIELLAVMLHKNNLLSPRFRVYLSAERENRAPPTAEFS